MRKAIVGVCALGLIAALVVGVLWATGGSATGKGIVFQAKVDGLYQLFRIDPDGSHLRQITHLAVRNSSVPGVEQPTWSPDAKRIIFDSDYGRTKQWVISLYTIKPDGGDLARVPLALGQFIGAPAYSPDGTEISFDWDENALATHQQGIDIAPADGHEFRQLTALDSPVLLDQRSNWSPDGKWIVFTEFSGPAQSAIVKLRADGTGRKELTPWALNANNAKWSPDGSQIAFNSHNDPSSGGEANLYTMRPDGSGLVQITHYTDGKLNAYLGGWSPDGKHLVFHLRGPDPNAPGVNQLFVVDADGSNARQLTHLPHGANPGYASWSPAG